MAQGKSWYDTGFDAPKREQAERQSRQGPGRFYVPKEVWKEFVFLDDLPFCIYEHHFWMNGSWRNYVTCLRGCAEETPCCGILGEKSRGYVGFMTVIDASKWTDKKGNAHQYELNLFSAKNNTLKKFDRRKKERGSLVGAMFKGYRDSDKLPSCGDEFEFIKEVDLAKVFEFANYRGQKLSELYAKANTDPSVMDFVKRTFSVQLDDKGKIIPKIYPFNYLEILKPKTPDEIKAFLAGQDLSGGGDNKPAESKPADSGAAASDDVPF